MKKVIYMPRRGGAKNFNIELDTTGGSYLDFPMFDTVKARQEGLFFRSVTSSDRGARFNYVSTEPVPGQPRVTVNICAEVIPDWNSINSILNNWEQNPNRYVALRAEGPATPFYVDSSLPRKVTEGFNRAFYPSYIRAPRQTVYAAFYNIPHVNEGEPWANRYNTNVLFRVNCENSADFPVNFFETSTIGHNANGSRFNSWRNLYAKLDNGVMAWTNNMVHLDALHPYDTDGSRLYFPKCVAPNYVNMGGVNYYLQGSGNTTPEECGIDSNYFNTIINL